MSHKFKILWDSKPKSKTCARCGAELNEIYWGMNLKTEEPEPICKKCFDDEQQQQRQVEFPKTEEEGEVGEVGEKGEVGEVFYEWYPAFKLSRNPFQTFDYRVEQTYGIEVEYLDTPGSKLIHNLAISGCSAFIVGERGCGKTTALDLASSGLKNCFFVPEPRTMLEIFNEIWNLNIGIDDEYFNTIFQKALHKWFNNLRCMGCRRKCNLRTDLKDIRESVYWLLCDIKVSCPVKTWIFNEIINLGKYPKNPIFLIDCPDDILEVGVYEFSKLIGQLLDLGATVIITSTPEQYEFCLKSDTLARLIRYDFPPPTKEQLREIIIKRIRAFQNWDESAPIPFSDDVISYLIEASAYNIRRIIYNCQKILQKMWEEQMDTPCNLGFAQKLVKKEETRLSLNQMLYETIKELKAQGKTWVYVSEIISSIENKYNMKISSERVGRLLSRLWRQGTILDRRELHGFIQYRL